MFIGHDLCPEHNKLLAKEILELKNDFALVAAKESFNSKSFKRDLLRSKAQSHDSYCVLNVKQHCLERFGNEFKQSIQSIEMHSMQS